MKITVDIDGKRIRFESSRRTSLIFKKCFHKDLVSEISRIFQMSSLTENELEIRELNDLFHLAWAYAKTADGKIPDPEKWLKEFNVFPIKSTLVEIQDLLIDSINKHKRS